MSFGVAAAVAHVLRYIQSYPARAGSAAAAAA